MEQWEVGQLVRRLFGVADAETGVVMRDHDGLPHAIGGEFDDCAPQFIADAAYRSSAPIRAIIADRECAQRICQHGQQRGLIGAIDQYEVMRLRRLEPFARSSAAMVVRSLNPDDAPAVMSLAEHAAEETPFGAPDVRGSVARFLLQPSLGAFCGGRLVGFLGTYLCSGSDFEIGRGYVEPQSRGNGILSRLTHDLCELVLANNSSINLWGVMQVGNKASKRALSLVGFRCVGTLQIVTLTPGS